MTTPIVKIAILALSAGLFAALYFAAAFPTAASAQTSGTTQTTNVTQEVTRTMQLIVNQTAFENRTVGDLTLSHRWSQIVLVPAGGSRNLNVFCENGELPTGGGFKLGSPDLQALSSHAFVSQNGSSFGWAVSVYNTNALTQAPAAADVLCLSERKEAASTAPQATTPQTSVPESTESKSSTGALTVETDSSSYSAGDIITISGAVKDREPDASVLITIVNPSSEQVLLDSVSVTASNTYKLSFKASNSGLEDLIGNIGTSNMGESGSYLVTVNYCRGIDCQTAETTFEFNAGG